MTSLEYCLKILRPAAAASPAARHCLSLNAMAWPLWVVCSVQHSGSHLDRILHKLDEEMNYHDGGLVARLDLDALPPQVGWH